MLGAGPSSRLFRLVREERGLAYTVASFGTYHSDAGVWTVYAGTAPEKVGEVSDVILSELEHLRKEGITPEELALAKAKLRGTLILSLDSNADRMGRLGSAAVIEREILSPEELIARLEALTHGRRRRGDRAGRFGSRSRTSPWLARNAKTLRKSAALS